MRYCWVVAACLLLTGAAAAQTHSDAACLDLGDLTGQPLGVLWANSFNKFFVAYEGELSEGQTKLVQRASNFGLSKRFDLNDSLSIQTMKGFVADARKVLSIDQFSEILAGMGPDSQHLMAAIGVIKPSDIACSCETGGNDCPDGFPCTVGCVTWGSGRWNGICKRAAVVVH